MAAFRVTRGEVQFDVPDLDALTDLAKRGEIDRGDLVQPPGAEDWMYVGEVPQLAAVIPEEDELDYKPGGNGTMIAMGAMALLGGFLLIGGIGLIVLVQQLPSGNEQLLGDGGLAFTQVLVTEEGGSLLAQPQKGSPANAPVAKDSALDLVAKRGDFYLLRSKAGIEGWMPVTSVLPMYKLGGAEAMQKFDPLYNPDRYVTVMNASWNQMIAKDEPPPPDGIPTNFGFVFGNDATYDMTDLIVECVIQDANENELQRVEFTIGGVLPAREKTNVGTIAPLEEEGTPTYMTVYSFEKALEQDPTLEERWTNGITAKMQGEAFASTEINIVQLRAVPQAE